MFAANIYRYWIFETAFQLTRFRTLSLWWINNLYAVLSFWFVSSQNCAGCWRAERCVVRQSYPPTHGVLLFVTVQLPTYADNVALPAFVRLTPLLQQSIDISWPPGPQPTAANLQQRVCCCEPMLGQTDGQTNGRTPHRFIDPALHTMPGSANKPALVTD